MNFSLCFINKIVCCLENPLDDGIQTDKRVPRAFRWTHITPDQQFRLNFWPDLAIKKRGLELMGKRAGMELIGKRSSIPFFPNIKGKLMVTS